jgi:sodium-dependent dicarboxylate transporter 2/3/5
MHSPGAGLAEAEEKFERWRNTIGLFLGPAAFLAIWFAPLPSLTPEAHRLSAILGLVLIYWMTEAVPIPVTALLGAVLSVLFKIATAKNVLAPFADPIVFLFIGSFIIANAMMHHGLDRRFALSILSLRFVGRSPARLVLAFGGVTAFISMWISNTAATAMMLPIGIGMLKAVGEVLEKESGKRPNLRRWRLSSGLMLMVAYSASVGGIGTPVGSPPNLIAIGMLDELAGQRITFFRWMSIAVPMMIAMYAILYLLILRLNRPEVPQLVGIESYIGERQKDLGRWSAGQRNSLIAFLVAVTLWILPGFLAVAFGVHSKAFEGYSARFHEGTVAILAASILFFLPVNWKKREFTLDWDRAVRIDWGTILLFGGGLALGGLMFKTGLAEVIGKGLMAWTGADTLWGITAAAIGLGIVVSETTSNTASASMVIPVMIALSQAAGVSPIPPALGACFGASYGFMLPVSTPPNAIAYSSGMVPIMRMVKTGIVFDICGFFLILGGLRLLCPLLGMGG